MTPDVPGRAWDAAVSRAPDSQVGDAKGVETRLRPMTAGDVEAVTEVHLAAFRGYLNTRLGRGYLRAFLGWFVRDEAGIALVVECNGRCAGYVVGAPLGYQRRLSLRTIPAAALGALVRPWVVFDTRVRRAVAARMSTMLGSDRTESVLGQTGTFSLVGIAVDPAVVGQGLGAALMSAFEKEARRAGARDLRLSVYPDNAAARRLYERCGWGLLEGQTPGGAVYYAKVLV